MAEDRGGLQYTITVDGDFETRFKAFEDRLTSVKAKLDGLATSQKTIKVPTVAEPRTQGGGGSTTDKKLTEQAKVRIKLAQVQERLASAVTRQLQAQLAVERQKEKAIIAQNTLKAQSLSLAQREADASLKLSASERNRQRDLELVRRAKLKQLSTEEDISKFSGLSVQRVRELVPELAKQAAKAKALATFEKERLTTAQRLNKVLTAQGDGTPKSARDSASVFTAASKEQEVATAQAEKATKFNDLNLQATQRNAAATRELGIKKAQILQIQRSQNISQRKAADLVGVTSAQAKKLGLNMFDASHAARQFLFTFRRLVGILAVFTAARKFAQAIGAAVREMSSFNAELEQAQTGIATIISSVGRVFDEQGNLVSGAEEYNAALAQSSALVNQLRSDAIGSISTFEELTRAFQVAVGPGLSAGLDLEQIRTVSKGLAEGAKVFGIPINQLSEEIRSLLKGTATARNTRLAQLFGGAKEANEAIRLAKEQGNLYEVLTEKLAAVGEGAKRAAGNFNVLSSDLEDALKVLLSQGGIEYFESLKDALRGLKGALVDVQGDETVVAPEALDVVRELSDGLSTAINDLREFTDTSEGFALLQTVLEGISGAIKTLAPLAVSLFSGLVTGIGAVLKPFAVFLDALGDINQIISSTKFGKVFLNIAKYTAATLVFLIAWKKILVQIGLLVGAQGLVKSFQGMRVAIALTVQSIRAVNGQLTLTNILSAIFVKQLDVAVVKATAATAGISLLVGLLVLGIAKMTVLKNETVDMADETEDVLSNVRGAVDAMAEGARTAKDWSDEFKDIQREASKIRATLGLSEIAKDASDIVSDFKTRADELNKAHLEQIETQKKLRSGAEKDLKIAQAQLDLEEQLASARARSRPQGLTSRFPVGVTTRVGEDPEKLASQERIRKIKSDKSTHEGIIKGSSKAIVKNNEEVFKNLSESLDKQAASLEETAPQTDLRLSGEALKLDRLKAEGLKKSVANVLVSQSELRVAKSLIAVLENRKELDDAFFLDQEARLAITKETALSLREVKTAGGSSADFKKQQAAIRTFEASLEAVRNRAVQERLQARAEADEDLRNKQKEADDNAVKASTSLGDNLGLSLQTWVDGMPGAAEMFAETLTEALSDLSGVVADVFKDAIDPRTSPDIKTAFGEFFLGLAGQFVDQITQQLIASGIQKILERSPEESQEAQALAATRANTASNTATTTALGVLNTTLASQAGGTAIGGPVAGGPVAGGPVAGGPIAGGLVAGGPVAGGPVAGGLVAGADPQAAVIVANTTALTALTTAVTANTGAKGGAGAGAGAAGAIGGGAAPAAGAVTDVAAKSSGSFFGALMTNPILLAILLPIILGLLAQAFNKGGMVKGYAAGGEIGGIPRPASIPRSDTVPAWLTPGEFVLPVNAVKNLGLNALEFLRAGVVPPSFAMAGAHLASSSKKIRGYATGGSVQSVQGQASRGSGSTGPTILPVQVTSNDNLDKMLKGGDTAFTKNMNSVNYTGDTNKSESW